jgi:hypothetical protein
MVKQLMDRVESVARDTSGCGIVTGADLIAPSFSLSIENLVNTLGIRLTFNAILVGLALIVRDLSLTIRF